MNKRMKPAQVLSRVRKAARAKELTVEQHNSLGKGSHQIYVIRDSEGDEVGRFGITGHNREVSWTVMRSIEDSLKHLFGDSWMEEK
ncbi:hypothetical protein JQX30_29095 [Saccharopolyspora erythraea]|nr:hypothetical protein JQX30_29095 [Saccharopolyspora erythraea]